ncbi:hypothetical protein ACFL3F_01930 [Planctomycetota bacterium]
MKKQGVLGVKPKSRCAVIVARPGDETLWAGGLLTMHPEVNWTLAALTGGKDPDQVQRFQEAAAVYGATAVLGSLYDDQDGQPMASLRVERAIMELLPSDRFEVLVTHAMWGEYTRDGRSEEVGNALQVLHGNQRLLAPKLLCFAYDDQDGQIPPQADTDADIQCALPEQIWRAKMKTMHSVYGYAKKDWRVRNAPKHEAFWCYQRHSSPFTSD